MNPITTNGAALATSTSKVVLSMLSSTYNENTTSETASLRYNKIPFTVLFVDGRFQQQNIGQGDYDLQAAQNYIENTAFTSQLTDLRFGFSTSPWRAVTFSAHYRRYEDAAIARHVRPARFPLAIRDSSGSATRSTMTCPFPDPLHYSIVGGKTLQDAANHHYLLHTSIASSFHKILRLVVETERIVLQQVFKPGTLYDGLRNGHQGLAQRLNLLVPREVEFTASRAAGAEIAQLLHSLESHLHVALAFNIEIPVGLCNLKDAAGKLRAHLNITVHVGRLDSL